MADPVRGAARDLWADIVLGQRDFGSSSFFHTTPGYLAGPCGCFLDLGATPYPLLYICDGLNNRVLVHQWRGITDWINNNRHASPYLIIGNDGYTDAANGDQNWQNFLDPPLPTAETLMFNGFAELSAGESGTGSGFSLDSAGRVHLVDASNNRALAFPRGSRTAVMLFGQADYSGWQRNRGGAAGDNTLRTHGWGNDAMGFAKKVFVDSADNRWITDTVNWRVLRVAAGASHANLVLGQPDFTTIPPDGENDTPSSALNRMGSPPSVTVNPARTKVYVCDGSNQRVLVFSAAGGTPDNFSNGMSGTLFSKIISGTGVTISGNTLTDGKSPAINFWPTRYVGQTIVVGASSGTIVSNTANSFTVDAWTPSPPANGTPYQLPWLRPTTLDWDTLQPTWLWILDTVDAHAWLVDSATGQVQAWKGDFTIWGDWVMSGGSLAVDSNGDVMVACRIGGFSQDMAHFVRGAGPTTYTRMYHPELPGPTWGNQNQPDEYSLGAPKSVCVTDKQVIVPQWQRITYWNGGVPDFYSGKAADGYLSGVREAGEALDFGTLSSQLIMGGAVDQSGHLWVTTTRNAGLGNYFLLRYDADANGLFVSGSVPAQRIALPLQTLEGASISYCGDQEFWGLAPNADSSELWVSNSAGNRVFRIRHPMTSPQIDCVLGQPSAASTGYNAGAGYGHDHATLYSLCTPGAIKLDADGNLWVCDDTWEVSGNFRLLKYPQSVIPSGNVSTIYSSSGGGTGQATLIQDNVNVMDVAIAPTGEMVAVYNPYGPAPDAGSESSIAATALYGEPSGFAITGRFGGVYETPTSPVREYLKDFGSFYSVVQFDAVGNLYISDSNRSRVLIYYTPFASPEARAEFSEEDVLAGAGTAVQWSFSYWKSSHQLERLQDITEYVVQATLDMDVTRAVKKHLTLTVRNVGAIDLISDQVLVMATATGADGTERSYNLGLFHCDFPKQRYTPGYAELEIDGYDWGIHLSFAETTDPFVVLAGMNLVDNVITILNNQAIWRIAISPSAATMPSDYTWPIGTSWLQIITDLLEMAGYYAPWVDANDYVTSRPYDNLAALSASVTYKTDTKSMVLPPVDTSIDAGQFANQIVVVPDSPDLTFSAVRTNADPASPISTVSLGYTKTQVVRAKVADQAAANARAVIELQVASALHQVATLITTLDPRRGVHEAYEIAIYDDPKMPYLDGKWWCQGWSMDLSAGGKMRHTLARVVTV